MKDAPGVFDARSRRRSLLPLLLLAVAFVPSLAPAQTTVVTNPRTLVFTPSADHEARLSDGRLKIDYYRFDVYAVGASQPFQSTDLGHPNPSADGQIYYDFSSAIAAWPLPGGNYEARVAAVGPMGTGTSTPSNPFTFTTGTSVCAYSLSGMSASIPAGGGGTQVSVTTGSGCAWTASANVSWITLSTAGGTGSGTVVATIAANTSTSARTGVITVAGQPFTVTQAGATATTPTPAPALPAPWLTADIGAVGLAGSASYASGLFTVTGSGADIWGTADSFRYVYQPLAGNAQMVARVTSLQNTHPYAKAGVMLRESLTAGSAQVLVNLLPGGGVELVARTATGATTTLVGTSTQAPPGWLRLVRNGTTVTASVSADGTTWRTVGAVTVSMASSAYMGLAVTSHNTGTRNTATFDNVSAGALAATTGLPAPWANRDIGTVGLSGSTSYASGRFTVTGSGSDIWGTADAFQFAHHPLPGDGQIVARLTSQQNTHSHAKAGIMLRSGLTAGAAHVILDVKPDGGVEFMTRSASGGSTKYLAGSTQAPPAWLRLVRTGSTVTASVSADGTTWRTVGTTTVSWGASGYAGLAVTSHNTSVRNTATFDNVTVR